MQDTSLIYNSEASSGLSVFSINNRLLIYWVEFMCRVMRQFYSWAWHCHRLAAFSFHVKEHGKVFRHFYKSRCMKGFWECRTKCQQVKTRLKWWKKYSSVVYHVCITLINQTLLKTIFSNWVFFIGIGFCICNWSKKPCLVYCRFVACGCQVIYMYLLLTTASFT